jgi:excisionase family DNA binding protein
MAFSQWICNLLRIRYGSAMPAHVDVEEAARHLGVAPSRVRALIAGGGLQAEKLGGRWLVEWDSVLARERSQAAAGRPLTARNAWALVLLASENEPPRGLDQHARWRIRQTLNRENLIDLRSRLERRARVHQLWALPGELRRLRDVDELVLSGSSAAGQLKLELLAPDTVDAYVPAGRMDEVASQYDLEPVAANEANVILRAVPDDAWLLEDRQVAPRAAVGLDLASYPDSRSARVGAEVLAALDAARNEDR